MMTLQEKLADLEATVKRDGGQAFPGALKMQVPFSNPPQQLELTYPGMSARCWLAGQALAGLAGTSTVDGVAERSAEETARLAVDHADAVLELLKPPPAPTPPAKESDKPKSNILAL